ncbi:hypothetical protein IJT93_08150 [bacterium]|nr:hypothetical protein [bacterium]
MNKAWRAAAFVSFLACLMGTADTDIASAQENYPKASRKKTRQTVAAPAAQSVTQDAVNASGQSSGSVSDEELERMRRRQAANEEYKKERIKIEQEAAERKREQEKQRLMYVDLDLSVLDGKIEGYRKNLPYLRESVPEFAAAGLNDGSIISSQTDQLREIKKLLKEYDNAKITYASYPDILAKFTSRYRTLADLHCKCAEVYEQVLDKRGIPYTKARSLLKF